MYEVYLDDSLLYEPGDTELYIFNTKLETADSKSGSFEFDITETNPFYDSIKRLTSRIRVDRDGESVFYGRVIDEDTDFYNTKTITCEGELAYLLDTIQEPKEYHHYSIRGFLEALIYNHNQQVRNDDSFKMFSVGIVTVTDPNDEIYRYTNWENTLTAINEKLVNRLGGHLRIRHVGNVRYLDYIESYDNTNTQVIEFGENLLDYSKNMTASDIATRVIPLGARLEESSIEGLEEYTTIKSVNNGKVYVESTEAVKLYGVITKTINYDDVTEPANLLTKGRKYLSEIQYEDMTLEVSAIDLNMVYVSIEGIKLGDDIRVVSVPHGMDRYFMVSGMSINLQSPESNVIKLGTNMKATLTERTAKANEEVKQKLEAIPPQSETLRLAIENATSLITAATTGHVVTRPEEILIMDTDDMETARKVWRWNLNGLGYSSTGYKGTYGTAITMDGQINGRYIAAKSIYADALIASELQTAWNGITNYIQLKNGELQVYNSANKKVSAFNSNGEHFYRDDVYVGSIGTNQWAENASHKGLVFDLEYEGKYMAWCYQLTSNAGSYTTMLCFSQGNSIYNEKGLHLGCDFYGEWFTLNNFNIGKISAGGYEAYTGTIPIVTGISKDGDKYTADKTKIHVANGIIVGYW